MTLTDREQSHVNKLNLIIKEFHENFPDNLIESGIYPCEQCNGAGILIQGSGSNLKSWNIGDYCESCKGVGYKGMKYREYYTCKYCRGQGCSKCSYIGKLNWLDNLVGV